MRKKILLPTPDYAPKVGGVARYLLALKQTFPDQVSVLYWPNDSMPHRAALRRALRERSTSFDEIWTSHVVPIGTALFINRLFGGKPYTVILHGMDFDLARRNPLR